MIKLNEFQNWLENTPSHIWPEIKSSDIVLDHLRTAAVAIILVEVEGRDSVDYNLIFAQRSDQVPNHPGQVSFPGGTQEEGENLLETAIRETHEETGVVIDLANPRWELLGRFPKDFVTISNYLVAPFLFVLRNEPNARQYVPDGREIVEVFETPLSHLKDPDNLEIQRREYRGKIYDLYFYKHEQKVIWGITGMILNQLLVAMDPFFHNGKEERP